MLGRMTATQKLRYFQPQRSMAEPSQHSDGGERPTSIHSTYTIAILASKDAIDESPSSLVALHFRCPSPRAGVDALVPSLLFHQEVRLSLPNNPYALQFLRLSPSHG
jgi:hypothetical protein